MFSRITKLSATSGVAQETPQAWKAYFFITLQSSAPLRLEYVAISASIVLLAYEVAPRKSQADISLYLPGLKNLTFVKIPLDIYQENRTAFVNSFGTVQK